MGSKKIKAVVIDDAGAPGVTIADTVAFKSAAKRFATALSTHPVTSQGLTKYGTNILVNILNEAGGLPTKNFRSGRNDWANNIGGESMTIIDLSDVWVTVNLREDRLAAVRLGEERLGRVPALGGVQVPFVIDYISPLGDFATWRATSDSGDFDLKTFEVRAVPKAPVAGLRPGMKGSRRAKAFSPKSSRRAIVCIASAVLPNRFR